MADTNSFNNEHARRWLDDLFQIGNDALITSTFSSVVFWPKGRELQLHTCAFAVAAAELVAAGRGKPGDRVPEDVSSWIAEQEFVPDDNMIDIARQALARIRTDSPLKKQWDEAGQLNDWLAVIQDVEQRIG